MENFENTRQTNYTIGEGYELPSMGKIYEVKVNPHVELRSMTARDEMKRLNPTTTPFKTLADIIEGCMIEKPAIHVYDMCLADYEFLLHKLRIVSYGDEYKVSVTCPFCGETFETIAHLESLQQKEFDVDQLDSLINIKLPKSGHTIKLNYTTPRLLDEQETKAKDMRRRFKDAEIDFNTMTKLTSIINTVDGVKLTEDKLESFVNKLPVLDMTKLLNASSRLDQCCGINTELELDCSECGQVVKTFFRFGPEFFRPTTV